MLLSLIDSVHLKQKNIDANVGIYTYVIEK